MKDETADMRNEIKLRKRQLRKELLARQYSLSTEYKKAASEKIRERVFKNRDYLEADTIFIYSGMENEVDTSKIIYDALSRGKRVAVPKVLSLRYMEAWRINSIDDLKPGKYGILEPQEGSEVIKPEDIDLVFVPCVSFNMFGYRLGYGGGFYDTFLPKGKFKKIIIAYHKMVYEDIPTDKFDIKADGIITESIQWTMDNL